MRFLTALSAVLLLACQDVSVGQEGRQKRMVGVKTRTTCMFSVNPDSNVETLTLKDVTTYNERGDDVESVLTCRDVTFRSSCAYQYDAKGRQTERRHTSNGELKSTTAFAYVADGSYKETRTSYSDEALAVIEVSEYGSDGKKKLETTTIVKTGKEFRAEYVYDKKGRLAETKCYGGDFGRTAYEYDAKNRFVAYTTYDEAGSILQKDVYERNDHGDPTLKVSSGMDGKEHDKMTVEYVYDANGRVLIQTERRYFCQPTERLRRVDRFTYGYELYEKK